ncbi:MAG: aldo/keto reductase [Acidobacteriota bacterium]|nr:aldo/keto reductase [Acidobacteriota bacterium]
MMARWHESLWPCLEELGVGYMAFSPLANGFLTGNVHKGMRVGFDGAAGDYRANMPQFTDANIERNQALLDMLDGMAAAHGVSVPQLSLAWMICKKPWLVPIPGSRKAERIAQNAVEGDVTLSADEISRIDTALGGMDLEVFGGNVAAK